MTKQNNFFALVGAIYLISAVVCLAQPADPRVVRLIGLHAYSPEWFLTVNGVAGGTNFSNDHLVGVIENLRLNYGDLIILSWRPDSAAEATNSVVYPAGVMGTNFDWLMHFADSHRVAIYLYGPEKSSRLDKVSTPVYHWITPWDNPVSLADARFFREGRALGAGQKGLDNLFRDLRQMQPKEVLFLGCLYDVRRSWSDPSPIDYSQLQKVLNENHIREIYLDLFPGI